MDIDRDLYAEMKSDRLVIHYLADRSVAVEFYAALCNVDWTPKAPFVSEDEQIVKKLRGDKQKSWSCSWRTAAGYIAEIRNMHYNTNEGYMDFYYAGNEGKVTDLVRECFDRMGWIPTLY